MVKQLHGNQNLLTALDLCQVSCQDLVNNFSEIYSKVCKGCKENKSNQYEIVQDLIIINLIINAANVKTN